MQAAMTMIGVAASLTIGVAALAERRRAARADLERVGFMPWALIAMLATFVALFAFAIALLSPA